MVSDSKVPPFEHVADRFVRLMNRVEEDVLMVAHNGKRFDVPFLAAEMSRVDREIPSNVYFADSLEILRRAVRNHDDVPQKFSLEQLRLFFELNDAQTHRAMDDCVLLSRVLECVNEKYDVDVTKALNLNRFKTSFSKQVYVTKTHSQVDNEDAMTTETALSTLTLPPMLRQYCETKREHTTESSTPLLLYRVGDFYEAYFEDASRLGKSLDMIVTSKKVTHKLKDKSTSKSGKIHVPMCGFPARAAARHCRSLMERGHVVIVCDQMESAADAAKRKSSLVERKVTKVLTPGTVIEEDLLDADRSSYLVSLYESRESNKWGLCYADVSTGIVRSVEGESTEQLRSELERLAPAELLVPATSERDTYAYDSKQSNDLLCLGGRNRRLYGSLCFAPTSSFSSSSNVTSRFLKDYYGLASLEGVGLASRPLAMCATAALIRYVKHTRPETSSSLQYPRTYDVNDCMNIDEDTWRNLEISHTARTGSTQGSLLRAIDRTETSMGRRLLQEWLRRPLRDPLRIVSRQHVVRHFVDNHDIRLRTRSVLRHVDDISRLAGRVTSGTASATCLLSLAESLDRLPSLANSIATIKINHEPLNSRRLLEWSKETRNTLASTTSENNFTTSVFELQQQQHQQPILRPGADKEVDRLREEAKRHLEKMQDVVRRERDALGGEIPVSLRLTRMFGHVLAIPSRYCKKRELPERYRRQQSLKAEERFTTPELLELDSKIKRAESLACLRERAVFESLLVSAANLAPKMRDAAEIVSRVDVLSSLATLASDEFYCQPEILPASRRVLDILDGRHPVIEQFDDSNKKSTGCVPNSICLGGAEDNESVADVHNTKGSNLIVLTGPNAAGKSVYLRQIAITQLLAQIGSFVPASSARISVVDRIFTRAGGADDVSQGQSTFMVEMCETANILNHATEESLVLLDEIGRGTATYDGLALAQAVSEHLSQKTRARTVFATHYHELNELEQSLDHVSTMHAVVVERDRGDIEFTFEMARGGAHRSHGIAVANLVGFPRDVTDRADCILRSLEESSSDNNDDAGFVVG